MPSCSRRQVIAHITRSVTRSSSCRWDVVEEESSRFTRTHAKNQVVRVLKRDSNGRFTRSKAVIRKVRKDSAGQLIRNRTILNKTKESSLRLTRSQTILTVEPSSSHFTRSKRHVAQEEPVNRSIRSQAVLAVEPSLGHFTRSKGNVAQKEPVLRSTRSQTVLADEGFSRIYAKNQVVRVLTRDSTGRFSRSKAVRILIKKEESSVQSTRSQTVLADGRHFTRSKGNVPQEDPTIQSTSSQIVSDPAVSRSTRSQTVFAGCEAHSQDAENQIARQHCVKKEDDEKSEFSVHRASDSGNPKSGNDEERNSVPKNRKRKTGKESKKLAFTRFHRALQAQQKKAGRKDALLKCVAPLTPCNHEGPCGYGIKNCSCGKNGFCSHKCLCSEDCAIKFRGCSCPPGACGTYVCPCFRAKWECNPASCKSCECEGDAKCKNLVLSQPKGKKLSVGKSAIAGQGLFLQEDVEKDDFIVEYKGVRVSDAAGTKRSRHYDLHKMNNYIFGLSTGECIDANEPCYIARFANHLDEKYANMRSQEIMVDGILRVGFFAKKKMPAGTELFFNYKYDQDELENFTRSLPIRSPSNK